MKAFAPWVSVRFIADPDGGSGWFKNSLLLDISEVFIHFMPMTHIFYQVGRTKEGGVC